MSSLEDGLTVSQGFICPLCMKMCVSATGLSEHYQNEHIGTETRRQEHHDLPAVTVGLVYFV
uniref:C2H2-type domain-containing protein n=1 Tax=Chrysemys picta bellii TaxID=8478 RepID=A0A8C3IWR3_CHRPI